MKVEILWLLKSLPDLDIDVIEEIRYRVLDLLFKYELLKYIQQQLTNPIINIYLPKHILDYYKINRDVELVFADRSSLVGLYCGWTYQKTKELFDNHSDSIIIMEDPYDLNLSTNDTFGEEALKTLKTLLYKQVYYIILTSHIGRVDELMPIYDMLDHPDFGLLIYI